MDAPTAAQSPSARGDAAGPSPSAGPPPFGGTGTPSGTPASPAEGFDWKAHIPEPLRGEKVWDDIKDFEALAKRFVDNHKYNVGALRLPGPNARPEAWDEVYNKLGRPASPDGYDVKPPALPEGVTLDEAATTQFLEHSHKLGLTPAQVQGVLDYYGDHLTRSLETAQQQTRQGAEATLKALEDEYGPVTFQRQLSTVQAFVKAEGDPELWQELEATGWGNHPQLTRLLMRLADDWRADQIAAGMKEEDFTGLPSPEAAGAEAKQLMADMQGPYWQRNHPLHGETRARVSRLMEIAHPNQRGRE